MRERCPECGAIFEPDGEYGKCDLDMGLWQIYHWCPCCGSPIEDYIVDSKGNIIGMFAEQGNKIRYVGMNFNICQSISRLLHGRIWHDTDYTNGTRFCFVAPKEPQQLAVQVV